MISRGLFRGILCRRLGIGTVVAVGTVALESPAVVLEGLLYLGDSAALETIHAEYENMAPPTPLPPMLAVSGDVPEGDQWVYDWKWDGVRAIVGIEGGEVRVHSRALRDITSRYPELQELAAATRTRLLLDGEIVALDEQGRPDFDRLQSRMQVGLPTPRMLRESPLYYYVLDLLVADGENLCGSSYRHRRDRLAELGLPAPPTIRPPDPHARISGSGLLDIAAEHGFEGIMAKRLDSPYRPGVRSTDWINTPLRIRQEVVIGGWVPGGSRHAGTLGTLLLGAYDPSGALSYIGHVETGRPDPSSEALLGKLEALTRPSSPFATPVPRRRARHARWVEPELVGEVEHRRWTNDRTLWRPSWQGLRTDREPAEVTLPV